MEITNKQELNKFFGVNHHFSSGVYVRQMVLKKGFMAKSHTHKYDHLSILAKGIAKVTVDGSSCLYQAPTVIEIKANKEHEIEAIGEVHWYCIHATDETDVNKIDEVLVGE